MILILFGIVFLMIETNILEIPVTMVTERAITMADSSFTVTARAEHIPSTNTVTGLLLKKGLVNIFLSIAVTICLMISYLQQQGSAP